MSSTVAVTGATGFLGRYIVASVLERGGRVVAAVRNREKAERVLPAAAEVRPADLSRRDELAEAFAGVDAVIANAGVVSLGGAAPRRVWETNVEGTRNVFDAAGRAGVKRAVMVSSVVVYRKRRADVPDEEHARRDPAVRLSRFNAYALSKTRAEDVARELAARGGIALTTLRPDGIFGAFDTGGFTYYFKRLMALPVAPYPVGLRLGLAYAADVADATVLCLERPESVARSYNVCGDEVSAWEFARAWCHAGGKSPRLLIPVPVPSRQVYRSERIRRELGWRTRPLEDGIRDMLRLEANERTSR